MIIAGTPVEVPITKSTQPYLQQIGAPRVRGHPKKESFEVAFANGVIHACQEKRQNINTRFPPKVAFLTGR